VSEKATGVRYAVEVYICSDETGIEACVRIAFSHPVLEIKPDLDPRSLLASFGNGLPDVAADWRFMTEEEIDDYRRAA
jgi:hypothetical protein